MGRQTSPPQRRPNGTPPLYVDDKELAALLGIPVDEWRTNAIVLQRAGLPRPDPLFTNRRYWPAVKAFLDHHNGMEAPSPQARDGEEHWDD